MKRRFRYDRATDSMIEVPIDDEPDRTFMVAGDIPPFRSPLDGTVVEGRREYHNHMRKHGVVPFEQGSEKATPAKPSAHDKQALREQIWERVDRVNQGHKAQD